MGLSPARTAVAPPGQVLRLLGSNPSKGEMDELLKSIDKNQDGVVDLNEFARVWWKREQQNIEADFEFELELAFQLFDTDDSGFITRDELREKLTTLGEKLTEQEVDELLAEADSDNNGSISLEEFKALPFWRM
jgi:calmodulin|eukprot:Transcript_4471.p2 GENE.Transcript_4471~~Transcript_4471.p2  ORF type:complete len:134 (-),score=32.06 Transcript_4471:171-572(-)